jgi:hypothetical protein
MALIRSRSRNRNRNRNRNLSKVGNGIVINGYGSATLLLRDYLIITHIMVLCRLYILVQRCNGTTTARLGYLEVNVIYPCKSPH